MIDKFVSEYTGEQYDSAIGKVLNNELGIPSGGSTGQILRKVSDTDLDTQWADAPETGVTESQMDEAIQTAIDGLTFEDGLPAGGSAGQVLAKKTATDFDTEWINAPSGGGGVTEEQMNAAIETAIQEAILDSWEASY